MSLLDTIPIALAAFLVAQPLHYEAPPLEIQAPLTIEEQIKKISPELIKVAKCESGLRQFDDNGNPIRGIIHPPDTGLFQINTAVHGDELEAKNIKVETLEGNLKFARILYERNGLRDWEASRPCWERNGDT